MVVGELGGGVGAGHAFQHPPGFPSIRPAIVGQRVADGVVGDGMAIVARQLVLPVGVGIGIGHGLLRRDCAQVGCRRVGVTLLPKPEKMNRLGRLTRASPS